MPSEVCKTKKSCRKRQLTKRRQTCVLPSNKGKVQVSETDQTGHLLVYIHLCESRAAERSTRGDAAKQFRKKRGEKTNKKRQTHSQLRPEYRPVFFIGVSSTRCLFPSSMSDESASEEWWFEVRPKGTGRKQPRPTDEISSVSSDSSSSPGATSARWCETFAT